MIGAAAGAYHHGGRFGQIARRAYHTSMNDEHCEASASPAGWTAELTDEQALRDALARALDYRGDVRITMDDGRQVSGYLFDCALEPSMADSKVRLLCEGSDKPVTIRCARITGLSFDDRDPAAGKSWETWLRRYAEKRAASQSG